MDTKVYINDINKILSKCFENSHNTEIKSNKTNTNKTPFAMKQFKTMYGQFLYRKEMNKKYQDTTKKTKSKLINSLDEVEDENYTKWINLEKKEKLNLINIYLEKNKLLNTEFSDKIYSLLENNLLVKENILFDYRKHLILRLRV